MFKYIFTGLSLVLMFFTALYLSTYPVRAISQAKQEKKLEHNVLCNDGKVYNTDIKYTKAFIDQNIKYCLICNYLKNECIWLYVFVKGD